MYAKILCGTILAAVAVSLPDEANGEVDWAKLNVAAREQAKVPVRGC